jgi:heptaprenyl diphosphate synthase
VNIPALLDLPGLEEDLARVEAELRKAVASEDPFLTEVARHLVDAGGKRIRPVLTAASAATAAEARPGRSVGAAPVIGSSQDVVLGGVSVELVHVGSLCHDDVIDEAATRRGVDTVNAKWGNLIAILAGDFLLARASEIAASLGNEVAGLLAATIARLCQGQTLEVQTAFDVERTEAAYFAAIAGKTASLMATACRVGGLTSGQDREQIEALTGFGHAFGMAFQVCDDVLDLVGTDESLGKPAGLDLTAGVYTLPVIRALADPEVGPRLRPLLGDSLEGTGRDTARDLVRSSGAVAAALGTARQWADRARAALAPLDGAVAGQLAELSYRLIDEVPLPHT